MESIDRYLGIEVVPASEISESILGIKKRRSALFA